MAAPTSVRVEAVSITSNLIRWSYAGSSTVAVYRSTDGAAYTQVALVALGTTQYEDTGLEEATKYWYKLSDDNGSTFSSVVTVITQTCMGPTSDLPFEIGQFQDNEDITAARLNEMIRRVEERFQDVILEPDECLVCPSDGAVVFDCLTGCKKFVVIVDQDINSISVINCGEVPGEIEFLVPSGSTRGICGWPAGFGFSGDECTQAPITGPRSVSVGTNGKPSKSKPNTNRGIGGGSGGGAGGSACTCVPMAGGLTIKSCNANNSLKCSTTKKLSLIACGGVPPYTWSKTGTITLSATSGPNTTVSPPANSGSAVAGSAYRICYHGESRAGPGCGGAAAVAHEGAQLFGCDDALDSCSTTTGCTSVGLSVGAMTCVQGLSTCDKPQCNSNLGGPGPGGCSPGNAFAGDTADLRTAGMITDGCNPCGLAAAGATVSVTDAMGTVSTIILRP